MLVFGSAGSTMRLLCKKEKTDSTCTTSAVRILEMSQLQISSPDTSSSSTALTSRDIALLCFVREKRERDKFSTMGGLLGWLDSIRSLDLILYCDPWLSVTLSCGLIPKAPALIQVVDPMLSFSW